MPKSLDIIELDIPKHYTITRLQPNFLEIWKTAQNLQRKVL